jgi:hypothetical protein
MAVRCDPPERATQSWTTARRRSAARTCSMKRNVPSPENVVTEITKVLEQVS